MVSVPHSQFVHRKNADGTFVSFCRECFATVATSRRESELGGGERAHICDPADLERFTDVRQPPRSPVQSENDRDDTAHRTKTGS